MDGRAAAKLTSDCGETTMPDAHGRPYVYLAGPDVFFPDAAQRAEKMKAALAAREMVGLFPLDNVIDRAKFPNPRDLALAIARANEGLMRDADIILANIQPWRGVEADDGTAYEIGYMAALGKVIVLYTSDPRPFADRIVDDIYRGDIYQDGPERRGKSDRMLIEDFGGLADNLMLINAAVAAVERIMKATADPARVVRIGFEAGADFAKALWDAVHPERA
jgi:nucleoside 2-deoxyribosyltransferase